MMPSDGYWCEQAVVDGARRVSVAIEVSNGRFSEVKPDSKPAPGARRLAGLTIPGLANVHSHAFQRALRARSQVASGSFWTWRDVMYAAASRLNPDRYHRLARAVFAEMVGSGMSVVGEFHYVHHQPDGSLYDNPNAMAEALLAAAADAGIRITLIDTLYLHGGISVDGYVSALDAQLRFADEDADAWTQRVEALPVSGSQRLGAAVHSVRAVDPNAISTVAQWAEHRGAPLHAHVSEQVAEVEQCVGRHGGSPVQVLDQSGALGSNFTAIHATHVDDADIALLASSSSSVCMCPTTERDLGDGLGPTSAFAEAGIELSLGSDSHAAIDHFVEARTLETHERLRTRKRGLHGSIDLLTMATTNGHRHLGWDDAGSITVGNRADLTTVALDTARTAGAPSELAVENVVFSATAADVTTVVVDGDIVVADGSHASIDVARELMESIQELFG